MNDIEHGDLPELNIDPDTGEIIDFATEVVVADLPKMARGLRYRQAEIKRLSDYRDKEVNRIVESVDHKINKISTQMAFVENRARELMRTTGEKKLEYPGLGFFRFGQTRVKVDDTAYYEMSDVERDALYVMWSDNTVPPFKTKTTITPDKKVIKEIIDKFGDISGFTLTEPEETFTFKPEE